MVEGLRLVEIEIDELTVGEVDANPELLGVCEPPNSVVFEAKFVAEAAALRDKRLVRVNSADVVRV